MTPSGRDNSLKCGICLVYTSSKEGDYFCLSPCGHIYHFECIRDWICQHTKSAPCPSCRQTIALKNLVALQDISPTQVRLARKPTSMKFCILGDSGTGKTSLLLQYARGTFDVDLDTTVGCDMYFKNVEVSGKVITLSVWDCGGQDRFRAITPNYLRNANGFFLVYDVTKSESLESLKDNWFKMINNHVEEGAAQILIGNKSDLPEEDRKVPTKDAKDWATRLGINFLETSAKENHNVEAAFRLLVADALQNRLDEGFDISDLQNFMNVDDNSRNKNFKKKNGCSC